MYHNRGAREQKDGRREKSVAKPGKGIIFTLEVIINFLQGEIEELDSTGHFSFEKTK